MVKPIDSVIRDRAAELLSIEGVVGVFEGKLEDGRVCIRVAVATRSSELDARLPLEIEGYPVTVVETGPVGPLH
ncbi:MAG: hypothetical protein OEX18_00790 [Candidatus Krumholzibacteria bacterium]|nr:hypothetical protein [Candidatus Krumholzibacteria bacterium]MDH4335800.1 hypothetical protein [Candidatus Krumholzibacteria bacterium]MDH5269326.1 hypothetical protein [Candidatus Krumholzibacteria bacterium]MDH5627232.1 hypothetical protein [Candidatus Krumholzibacteria bacterium]